MRQGGAPHPSSSTFSTCLGEKYGGGGWEKDDEIINKYNIGEEIVVCKYAYYRGGRIDQGMDAVMRVSS